GVSAATAAAPSMDDACDFECGASFSVYATPLDPNDANSWTCFPTSLTATIAGPATATIGDDVMYTVTVHNNGLTTAPNAQVDIGVPAPVVSAPGACTAGGGLVSCDLGTIAANDLASFDITLSTI